MLELILAITYCQFFLKKILLKVTLGIKAAREAQNSPDIYAYVLFLSL